MHSRLCTPQYCSPPRHPWPSPQPVVAAGVVVAAEAVVAGVVVAVVGVEGVVVAVGVGVGAKRSR